jgi:hypothetical protein
MAGIVRCIAASRTVRSGLTPCNARPRGFNVHRGVGRRERAYVEARWSPLKPRSRVLRRAPRHDCTNGYGPEEFILRHAKPGKYKVEVNLFGDQQQLVNGPTGFPRSARTASKNCRPAAFGQTDAASAISLSSRFFHSQ